MILCHQVRSAAPTQGYLPVLDDVLQPQPDQFCLVSFRVQEHYQGVVAVDAQQVVSANKCVQIWKQRPQCPACELLLMYRKVV